MTKAVRYMHLLLWFVVGSTAQSGATVIEQKTFAAAYRDADVVVAVRVEKSQPQLSNGATCGFRYSALQIRQFKGEDRPPRRGLQFGRSKGLVVGKEYLLFLRKSTDPVSEFYRVKSLHPEIAETYPSPHALDTIKCNGLVPGLTYDPDFAWPVGGGKVFVFGIWEPRDVPSGVRVDKSTGPLWELRASDVFKYLDDLGRRPARYQGRQR